MNNSKIKLDMSLEEALDVVVEGVDNPMAIQARQGVLMCHFKMGKTPFQALQITLEKVLGIKND